MSAPPILTELRLSEDMQRAVDTAFETLKPIVVSYVDENGAPQLSFRGSTQAHSETQLAIWVRNPEGRILVDREEPRRRPALRHFRADRSGLHDLSRASPRRWHRRCPPPCL